MKIRAGADEEEHDHEEGLKFEDAEHGGVVCVERMFSERFDGGVLGVKWLLNALRSCRMESAICSHPKSAVEENPKMPETLAGTIQASIAFTSTSSF